MLLQPIKWRRLNAQKVKKTRAYLCNLARNASDNTVYAKKSVTFSGVSKNNDVNALEHVKLVNTALGKHEHKDNLSIPN